MKTKILLIAIFSMVSISLYSQNDSLLTDSIVKEYNLNDVTISARRPGAVRLGGVVNGLKINKEELFKAACCNLGESFTTNPSVDVNYSDATTGAKQIKLLGLSGTYVQMLTENIPNFRGAAIPYSLGYVPGPWMKSIQVSKGAASVKNGYESITGQIDIEYLKPQDPEGVSVNLFGNSKGRFEANVDANIHIKKELNTEILAHYENEWGNHDNSDNGFLDKPKVTQYNLQNRWNWIGDKYIFHGGIGVINEKREGGQVAHSMNNENMELFKIGVDTKRYEGYMKHAYIINPAMGSNIAWITSGSIHDMNANYGHKIYDVNQKNLYSQLMFETNIKDIHNISLGLSLNHDNLNQDYRLTNNQNSPLENKIEEETTIGGYAQYTLNLSREFTAMGGIRVDHSSKYGVFVTPRVHLKYTPSSLVSFRVSAGKGYRSPFALAENNYLLASGRELIIEDMQQERAWNYGLSSSFYIPLFNKTLKLNAEYYYTNFSNQLIVDYDSNPSQIQIENLKGSSYSHMFQIDASYPIISGLDVTLAYRLNDVKSTYNGVLQEKPLTSKYKGLFTASYRTPLGKWQFDATFQLNGGGRMPTPYTTADGTLSWSERFPTYGQLNLQVTRWFRKFSIYVGAENLTNYLQKNPIINADNPWGGDFEPTMIWGPVHGATFYAGIRFNFGNR